MAKLEPYVGDYYLWEYIPSLAASIIFLLLFLILTVFHTWKAWKTRARFCFPFCIGGWFEVTGFAARAACTNLTGELLPYIIQSVFILLGPVLFAASVYMVLARLIRSVGAEKYSLIRIDWVTRTFVIGDIISFLVQGNGAGMMAMDGMADIAKGIVLAGLVLQIFTFGLFIVTGVVFERRMRMVSTMSVVMAERGGGWKKHLYPLYVVSGLIMVRSVFRVVEYAMGQKGYLLSNEWPMFVFDAVLMVGVMVIWGYWHPGMIGRDVAGDRLLRMESMRIFKRAPWRLPPPDWENSASSGQGSLMEWTAIPTTLALTILHWLVSQAFFFADLDMYRLQATGETIGPEPNSASIAAACHPSRYLPPNNDDEINADTDDHVNDDNNIDDYDEEEEAPPREFDPDLAHLKLACGVVEEPGEGGNGIGHVTFAADEVSPLIEGKLYA